MPTSPYKTIVAPPLHQHMLKVAVIDTSGFGGEPTAEVFRSENGEPAEDSAEESQ
jgi:hypothetical protein